MEEKDNIRKERIRNLVDYSRKGFRVKHTILALLEDEIEELLKQKYPIKYIHHLLQDKYNFSISYRHFYRFVVKLDSAKNIKKREKKSKTPSNFQRLPSQDQYNSTVSEEESSGCSSNIISPYENEPDIVLDNKAAESSCNTDRPIQSTITSSQEVTSQTPPPDTKNESDNKKYEIAPIGIEKKYSLEEIFPKEKWRFDVYNLPLKEGLEKEIDDMYIIDAFECAKEFLKIAHGGREFRNEKTDFLWRLLWRVMKKGYKLDNMEMKYDKEAENVYEAIGYEVWRLRREAEKDKPLKLTKPECDTSDFVAVRRKYKERKLKRIMDYINNKKEKK